MLTHLKMAGVLSAKQACVLAFWAAKAGAIGEVSGLGVRPDQESGEYSKRYDRWAGANIHDQAHYPLWVGRKLRHEAGRVWSPLPARPPHEALLEELARSPAPDAALRAALKAKNLPPKYYRHEFVRSAPDDSIVHPIVIYMDGVAFSRHDSALGIWVQFLLSPVRHFGFCYSEI